MRLVKEKSFSYGRQNWSVEAKTEEQLSCLTEKLDAMGWAHANSKCECNTDYGFAIDYGVDASEADQFRADFKIVKKQCLSEPTNTN